LLPLLSAELSWPGESFSPKRLAKSSSSEETVVVVLLLLSAAKVSMRAGPEEEEEAAGREGRWSIILTCARVCVCVCVCVCCVFEQKMEVLSNVVW
jgi:hypothetical protein